ncbi:phosphoserine phosphatase SerB [Gulbenkiania mobilis]|uniref:phosphoserine phosphatase SerB n=1 Tax=Gulbenkiania mobilis TaxID=397457 RepID=UPI0006BBD33C|nr:phosphoserine phosphatase SerB [Gulbenkiania mobilis]
MQYALVLQADRLEPGALAEVAHILDAPAPTLNVPGLARFENADPAQRDRVATFCEARNWDAAFVPATTRWEDLGLLVSDMDSTLITIECIDEIAAMQGLKAQVAAITERSMRGEIDFTASLKARVALLEGLEESALDTVYRERLQLTPGAETLLAHCRAHGVKFMLVSGGFTFFTERLKAELGLDYAFANELEVANGRLTGRVTGEIVDARAKRTLLMQVRETLGLAAAQVIAMGDGANDLEMLAEAGVGIAFHAKPVVCRQADVAIRHGGLDRVIGLFA